MIFGIAKINLLFSRRFYETDQNISFNFSAVVIVACAPRDTTHYLSIQEALSSPEAKNTES